MGGWWQQIQSTFFDWDAMAKVLPTMFAVGLRNTLILAFSSTVVGIIIGLGLALMSISHHLWVRIPAKVYIDVFRGLPAILTILLVGQGFAQFTRSVLGPSPYPLGIIALGLISSAYIGEIFRSGIQSVDKGQLEACRALGMSYSKSMLLVVVPQGIRRVLPALMNQFIGNTKDSSLVYFLGLLTNEREIFRIGQDSAILSGNLSPLLLAGIFYLVITVPLTHLVNYMEKRLQKGRRIKPTVVNTAESALEPDLSGRGDSVIDGAATTSDMTVQTSLMDSDRS